MNIPHVSHSVWEKLYACARELERLNPWEWIDEDILFGVENPVTHEIGYCRFSSGLEEDDGFDFYVYRGNRGKRLLDTALACEFNGEHEVSVALDQDCLSVEFRDREELEANDRKVCKAIQQKLSKYRYVPIFRSTEPGFMEWFLNEDEAKYLITCLERAIVFVQAHKNDYGLPDVEVPGALRVDFCVQTDDGPQWETRSHLRDKDTGGLSGDSVVLDEVRIKRIEKAKYPHGGQWEVSHFFIPIPVTGKNKPGFTRIGLIVDRMSEEVVAAEATLPDSPVLEMLVNTLLQSIDTRAMVPQRLCVSKPDLHAGLKPLAKRLGIEILFRERLYLTEETQDNLISEVLDEDSDELGDQEDCNDPECIVHGGDEFEEDVANEAAQDLFGFAHDLTNESASDLDDDFFDPKEDDDRPTRRKTGKYLN